MEKTIKLCNGATTTSAAPFENFFTKNDKISKTHKQSLAFILSRKVSKNFYEFSQTLVENT